MPKNKKNKKTAFKVLTLSQIVHAARIVEAQETHMENTGKYPDDAVSFVVGGVSITNPFTAEQGWPEVDPVAYYGKAFLKSDFVSDKPVLKSLWGAVSVPKS